MFKKSKIKVMISVLCILLFLTGCNSIKTQVQTKGGLKINSWSSGLGAVNETNLDKTRFSYSINLSNENDTNIFVKSAEPVVNEKIKNKVLSSDITVAVNKDLKPNETIQINGGIIVDTMGLTKSDIEKLEPFITDVKISSEETISLKNN